VFRFALVGTDGEAYGTVAFARSDFKPGDLIPQGKDRMLRVVDVIATEHADELPLLLVEVA
jgi:hypothetical protein